jgi:hypothetical protein
MQSVLTDLIRLALEFIPGRISSVVDRGQTSDNDRFDHWVSILMNEDFWEFANRIIHSEAEMSEGSNLQSIYHFKLDRILSPNHRDLPSLFRHG